MRGEGGGRTAEERPNVNSVCGMYGFSLPVWHRSGFRFFFFLRLLLACVSLKSFTFILSRQYLYGRDDVGVDGETSLRREKQKAKKIGKAGRLS